MNDNTETAACIDEMMYGIFISCAKCSASSTFTLEAHVIGVVFFGGGWVCIQFFVWSLFIVFYAMTLSICL